MTFKFCGSLLVLISKMVDYYLTAHFTQDIVRETTENIALFADDTALYHSSENSADVVTHLQHTGRRVQQYMDK